MAVTLQIVAAFAARVEFFRTVEFYVVATVVAAAVIILSTRPSGSKPVQTRFARATFEPDTEPSDAEPSLEVSVRDDGMVVFTRHGLGRIREGTMVALAITVKGFDVTLKERITAASSHAERMYARLENQDADASTSDASSMCCKSTALDAPEHKDGIEDFDKTAASASSHPVNMSAVFVLDFFAPEWYHIQYINEHDGRFAAFTLRVRPGIHTRRPFKR